MKSAQARIPISLLEAGEHMQEVIYKEAHTLLPLTDAMLVYTITAKVDEAQLRKIIEWIKANRKKARGASFVNLK